MIKNEMDRWKPLSKNQVLIKKKPLTALHFDVHVVEHCNLNCKGCNHLSPLAEEEYADIDSIRNDFERLYSLNIPVECILFLGGEPLLAPENLLNEMFNLGHKYFPLSRLLLLTNGIRIPHMKELFWDSCRRNYIEIRITKYPINLNYDCLRKIITSHNVKCSFSLDGDTKDIFRSIPIDLSGSQNPVLNYTRCKRGNACIILQKGKLYTCTLPCVIRHFNKKYDKNLVVTESDYVDIYKAQSAEEILTKLSNPIPFCRYCNIDNYIESFEWGRSAKNINEWT